MNDHGERHHPPGNARGDQAGRNAWLSVVSQLAFLPENDLAVAGPKRDVVGGLGARLDLAHGALVRRAPNRNVVENLHSKTWITRRKALPGNNGPQRIQPLSLALREYVESIAKLYCGIAP